MWIKGGHLNKRESFHQETQTPGTVQAVESCGWGRVLPIPGSEQEAQGDPQKGQDRGVQITSICQEGFEFFFPG